MIGDNVKVSQMFYRDIISTDTVLRHCEEIWFKKDWNNRGCPYVQKEIQQFI